jgi:hypothetical protein
MQAIRRIGLTICGVLLVFFGLSFAIYALEGGDHMGFDPWTPSEKLLLIAIFAGGLAMMGIGMFLLRIAFRPHIRTGGAGPSLRSG